MSLVEDEESNEPILITIVLAVLLLSVTACHNGKLTSSSNNEPDSLSIAAENQVEAVAETGDITRTIELADSFVNQNQLSSVRANFYKALASNRREDYPGMAEYIRKIVKAYEEGSDEDPLFYSRAAISLAGYYISMNQYEEAMNVAMPALARFEPDPNIQSDWKGIFLSFIGACQKKLNQPEEAKKNFEQAYQYYRKYMGEERFKLLDFQTCIVDLYNISMYYASKETLKEEQMWNDRCDSLLSWYRIQPGADSVHVEMMDGVIALRRAHILLDEGKKAEAANIYQDYDRIAGHNPPVVGGGNNQGDFLQMESNAPIGLWEGLEYEGEEIDTIKGRPLFIYTDGLNEAENRQQQQFGDDHLLDLLRRTQFASAQQVVESMVEAVSQHRDGAESNDDLTMMCICMD